MSSSSSSSKKSNKRKEESKLSFPVSPSLVLAASSSASVATYHHYGMCQFCGPNSLAEVHGTLLKNDLGYVIASEHPVTSGHVLIVPKEHQYNWFDLSPTIQASMLELAKTTQDRIKKKFGTTSFNLGINVGVYGGQYHDHAVMELIPRTRGDVPNPRGGVRGVIPGSMDPYHNIFPDIDLDLDDDDDEKPRSEDEKMRPVSPASSSKSYSSDTTTFSSSDNEGESDEDFQTVSQDKRE